MFIADDWLLWWQTMLYVSCWLVVHVDEDWWPLVCSEGSDDDDDDVDSSLMFEHDNRWWLAKIDVWLMTCMRLYIIAADGWLFLFDCARDCARFDYDLCLGYRLTTAVGWWLVCLMFALYVWCWLRICSDAVCWLIWAGWWWWWILVVGCDSCIGGWCWRVFVLIMTEWYNNALWRLWQRLMKVRTPNAGYDLRLVFINIDDCCYL